MGGTLAEPFADPTSVKVQRLPVLGIMLDASGAMEVMAGHRDSEASKVWHRHKELGVVSLASDHEGMRFEARGAHGGRETQSARDTFRRRKGCLDFTKRWAPALPAVVDWAPSVALLRRRRLDITSASPSDDEGAARTCEDLDTVQAPPTATYSQRAGAPFRKVVIVLDGFVAYGPSVARTCCPASWFSCGHCLRMAGRFVVAVRPDPRRRPERDRDSSRKRSLPTASGRTSAR